MINTKMIGSINKGVKELIESYEHDNIELDIDILESWIAEASDYDCISKYDLMKINSYMMFNGNSLDSLIKIYSYLNSTIEIYENELKEYNDMNG